jgi:hypothetical protein
LSSWRRLNCGPMIGCGCFIPFVGALIGLAAVMAH